LPFDVHKSTIAFRLFLRNNNRQHQTNVDAPLAINLFYWPRLFCHSFIHSFHLTTLNQRLLTKLLLLMLLLLAVTHVVNKGNKLYLIDASCKGSCCCNSCTPICPMKYHMFGGNDNEVMIATNLSKAKPKCQIRGVKL